MSVCFRRLDDALVQVAEDLVLADHGRFVVEDEHRDAVGAGHAQKLDTVGLLHRHLVDEVVDAELG
jgi:hypothetical protein